MSYIIKARGLYLKRTCNFGESHGNMVFTIDVDDAKRFTHKKHAQDKGDAIVYRMTNFEWESKRRQNAGIVGITTDEIQIIEYPLSGQKG